MRWLREVLERVRSLVFRGREERDLEEELRFHVERATESFVALGMTPEEARRRALVQLGGVERTKEEVRDARGVRPLEDLARDVRFAFRTLGRNPGFTVAAVLVLALGIGANTAIFSAVNAVVLRPLPFRDPGRLFMLWESNPEKGWTREVAAPANMYSWRERVSAFEDVGATTEGASSMVLLRNGEPELLQAVDVTGNFFSVLGVEPELGRTFRDEETWRTSEPVALLSDEAWHTRFGADPSMVGRLLELDGQAYRVVGVNPPGLGIPHEGVDVWITVRWDPASRDAVYFRRAHWIRPVARLRPGVSADQANAELQTVVKQLQVEYPETNRLMGAGMTPLHPFLLGETRTPLLVLLGAVGLLLLIACANVGNLMLVRAWERRRENAVRSALGAARGRLIRQVLTESLVLSVAGGALGLGLGYAGTRLLERLQPEGLLRVSHFAIDPRVVLFVVAATTLAGVLFGAIPAGFAAHAGPGEALREGARGGGPGRRTRRVVGGLVVAEIALALLLVVGGGLLVRSFMRLRAVDPGFDPTGVLTVGLYLPSTRYDTRAQVVSFYRTLLERVRSIPGVESAGATSNLPLAARGYSSDFLVAGRAPDEYGSEVVHRRVLPGYFSTMGVPLLAGRVIEDSDGGDSEPVVVINQALAGDQFPGEDPVGRRIAFDRVPDSTSTWWTIVGVVGSERQNGLALAPQIEVYEPLAQEVTSGMSLVLRASGDPESLTSAVRAIVREMDPRLPLLEVRTMDGIRQEALARERFLMTLLLAFAGVALLLALVGVYGVTAQAARQRTREIGIRIALGAGGQQVVRLALRQGLGLIAVGLAIGIAGALLATRLMTALLFQIDPGDPLTFGTVAALLAAAGLLASWLPARRASRVDPAEVLRAE